MSQAKTHRIAFIFAVYSIPDTIVMPSEDGLPAFETIEKVAQSLGYRLLLVPVSKLTVIKAKKSKNSKKARMTV